MLPPHVKRRLARNISTNSKEMSLPSPSSYIGAIHDNTRGTYISGDESNYCHALPQIKNACINPIFMPYISCMGVSVEQSISKMSETNIIPSYLKNLHGFTNNSKTKSDSLEAARALSKCRVMNLHRTYTPLSARSKHRHSLNPSFWIRNAKEHKNGVSQKLRNRNKFYRGARWHSEKWTGQWRKRIHCDPLEAIKRRTTSLTEVIPKRTPRPLRVH